MKRSILAVIAALISWVLVASLIDRALRYGMEGYAAAEPAMAFTLGMMSAPAGHGSGDIDCRGSGHRVDCADRQAHALGVWPAAAGGLHSAAYTGVAAVSCLVSPGVPGHDRAVGAHWMAFDENARTARQSCHIVTCVKSLRGDGTRA